MFRDKKPSQLRKPGLIKVECPECGAKTSVLPSMVCTCSGDEWKHPTVLCGPRSKAGAREHSDKNNWGSVARRIDFVDEG